MKKYAYRSPGSFVSWLLLHFLFLYTHLPSVPILPSTPLFFFISSRHANLLVCMTFLAIDYSMSRCVQMLAVQEIPAENKSSSEIKRKKYWKHSSNAKHLHVCAQKMHQIVCLMFSFARFCASAAREKACRHVYWIFQVPVKPLHTCAAACMCGSLCIPKTWVMKLDFQHIIISP